MFKKWLYSKPSKLVGLPFLFVYWDKKADVLEFNIFEKVFYFSTKES